MLCTGQLGTPRGPLRTLLRLTHRHRDRISAAYQLLSYVLKNYFNPLASFTLLSTNMIIFLVFLWAKTHSVRSPGKLWL